MRSKINLVILTPGFAENESDTTCIPSLQLYLENLKTSCPEIDISIIAFYYPFAPGHYIWKGIPVYATDGYHGTQKKMVTGYRVLKHLFVLNKTKKIDILHAFWLTDTALIGSFIRILTGIPIVMTAMGQDVKKENRYLRFIPFSIANLTFLTTFQSNHNSRLIRKRKFKVIPFGVDPGLFNHTTTDRTTDILGVGSLNTVKNFQDFIYILFHVSKVFPNIVCKILGEGPERESITKLISKFDLEKNVILTGKVSHAMVIREMHSAKVLLHTSKFEGQGLVINEALASGSYVVSYQTGIATELKSNKVFTGSGRDELIRNVINILQKTEPVYTSQMTHKISDTVNQFLNIYSEAIKQ
jgi:1,2-diacylglycerol 3-alpha-glucosyltransferase